jgi:hypothetical protein
MSSKNKQCKLRCKLQSLTSSNLTNASVGTVRCNLASNHSNNSNGVVIGNLGVIQSAIDSNNYFLLDSTKTEGIDVILPDIAFNTLKISFFDLTETQITSLIDFQCELFFDV